LALASQPQTQSGVHTGGNFFFGLLLFLDSALAPTGFTWGGNHPARPAALMAGAGDREESLFKTCFARTPTKITHNQAAGGGASPGRPQVEQFSSGEIMIWVLNPAAACSSVISRS